MTRKADREKRQNLRNVISRNQQAEPKKPIRIFGCKDCELLVIEYPDVDSISCPWCRQTIDVYASYSYVCFASGIQIVKTASAN